MVAERVDVEVADATHVNTDRMWNSLAYTIKEVAKESFCVVDGTSRGHKSCRESWRLSDEVQTKVAVKQLSFLELITIRDETFVDVTKVKERYRSQKRSKESSSLVKEKAYEYLYRKLNSKKGANDTDRIAKARERRRRDLDNIRYIKDGVGQFSVFIFHRAVMDCRWLYKFNCELKVFSLLW
ncbi:uncharacterized protein [Rutidosis leptorrhynchoides]|uniref:uncharacterized protein n=1 Tax=Rutidosis leptorrhynchoides TaxID=125765 RepID=UPI003A99CD03